MNNDETIIGIWILIITALVTVGFLTNPFLWSDEVYGRLKDEIDKKVRDNAKP